MRLTPGLLLTCDVALKVFLVHLDQEGGKTGKSFIIKDLGPRHLFVRNDPGIFEFLQKKIDDWHDKNAWEADEIED